MSQLTSAGYDLSTAGLEIILLVAGAFIAGALLCYLLRRFGLCCRRSQNNTAEDSNQALNNMPRDPVFDSTTGQYPAMHTTTVSHEGYEADIGSLIRSSGDGDGEAQPKQRQRTAMVGGTSATTTRQVSFEERARAKLADLRTTHSAEVPDYTLDLPLPDENHTDDLKKLEGIDPDIEKILNEAGIKSYAKLATMDRDHLKALLEANGSEFGRHEPKSWPYQAELAAKNNWSRLKEYQDFLLADRQ